MKHLILWGALLVSSLVLFLLYEKTSAMDTFFELDKSPIYADIIFFILGTYLAFVRGTALIRKLF